jgi:hypothetical protein
MVSSTVEPRIPGRFQIASRTAAALLGSYAFVWGLVALCVAVGARAMPFEEAETLAYLLAFPALLVCFCWAFVARSLRRVWAVLGGGGGLMTLVAWWIARGAS